MRFSKAMRIRSLIGAAIFMLLLAGCRQSPAEKSAKFIAAGTKLIQNHDAARAILQFRNAVQANPQNAEAYYQLGLAYIQAQDPIRAAACFRKAIEINKHPGAQLRMAQLLASTQDPELLNSAAETLQAFLRQNPENSDAIHALGLTELKLGSSREALEHLQRAVELAPEDWAIAASLADAKIQQKDLAGAEAILKQSCEKSPKAAGARVVLGRFYDSQRDFVRAEEQYRRALTLEPKNTAAVVNLAMLQANAGRNQEAEHTFKQLEQSPLREFQSLYAVYLFEEGKRDEAIREFEAKVKVDPDDRLARSRLVAAYQAVNRTSDAVKLLNDALRKNSKDLDALLQRGELSLTAKKYGDAEADLDKVVHARPDSPEAHYGMAKVYLARGAVLTYRQELNEVLRLNPALMGARIELIRSLLADRSAKAALAVLEETPPSQKNLVPMIEQRNWILLATNDIAGARQSVEAALKVQRTPDLLLQDAELKIYDRKFADGRKSLNEALGLAPEDVRLLRVLMQSYAAEKQTPTGVAEIRAYAAAHPKSPEVQYFLGNLMVETGNQAQALQAFTTARALDPGHVPASLEIARLNLKQANWTDARKELSDILTTQADNPLARLWLGMAEESVGNHDAAIEALRRVVDAEPNNSLALNNLAYLLVEYKAQNDEALKYAQKAKEVAPEKADVDDTLGWVLYHKGVYTMAIKYLEMANARGPDAVHRFHLAMAYLKAGDKDKGRTALNAALRLNPNLTEAKAAESLFQ